MSYEAMIPIVYPEVSCDLLVERTVSGHPQFFLLMLVKYSESLEALTSPLLLVSRKRKGNREAARVSRFRGKYFVFEIGFSRLQVLQCHLSLPQSSSPLASFSIQPQFIGSGR